MEGASMCLLSKVLPARLTRGIFNAGKLSCVFWQMHITLKCGKCILH